MSQWNITKFCFSSHRLSLHFGSLSLISLGRENGEIDRTVGKGMNEK